MNRPRQCFTLSVLSLLLFFSSTVWLPAQTVLERLEKQIRQRVEKGTEQGNPPAPPAQSGNRSALQSPEKRPPSGYLGVLANDRGDRGRGVRILDVYAGSPAEKAGLQKQDLVTGVGDVRVRQMNDLADVLALYAPGEAVELAVLRGSTPQKLTVTLGRPPEKKTPPSVPPEMIPAPPAQTRPGGPPAETPPGTRTVKKTPELLRGLLSQPEELPGEQGIAGQPDLILPPPQKKPPATAQEKIRELQNRVQELEQRVRQLERELAELKKKP